MTRKELKRLGLTSPDLMQLAEQLIEDARTAGLQKKEIGRQLKRVLSRPEDHGNHPIFGPLAHRLKSSPKTARTPTAPWRKWGENLDATAVQQMENACRLPVAVAGALMPDAHQGYGLPIGGVLATDNAVIPYAVGVDIACRVKMSVLDFPAAAIDRNRQRLMDVINQETRFGIGAAFKYPRDHEVMDFDWAVSPVTARAKDKARLQLGTSGSGNHFVEFGVLTLDADAFGLPPGRYLALLSHSGSRGAGHQVASHYSRLAMKSRTDIPRALRHLAWLDLDGADGQEYWAAMELMGEYASANHAVIHREILASLQTEPLLQLENHHNFAWKEVHNGRELIVHRKGATPAGKGMVGIIPGSMASPTYVVTGKGQPESFNSAAHGAGRVMSRKKAKSIFNWKDVMKVLDHQGITLMSAGLDEVPGVYKNIDEVMAYQQDLVGIVARFDPKIVKMAPAGERPED